MFCIGITGTICSGKSTVSRLFKSKGIMVISADEVAHELTQASQPALVAIEQHFGKEFIKPSGELNRAALREKIFKDTKERLWLEQLLHPLIKQQIWYKLNESSSPYAMIEIPLLNNRSDYPYLDRVLVILASHGTLLRRVMERDKSSKVQAETILALHAKEELTKLNLADDIIKNDGSIADLTKKVENLHCEYLQFASQKS